MMNFTRRPLQTAARDGHRCHLPIQQRCLSIGRILDMGGMPSAASDQSFLRPADASKNSKLQAIAFDFEVLTKSLDAVKQEEKLREEQRSNMETQAQQKLESSVEPDLDLIRQFASLLNVDMDMGKSKPPTKKKKVLRKTSPLEDVRAKYASKLQGGLAGIELAKSKIDETLKAGDAAGHMAARKMALQDPVASPSKWMALTGVGKLLSHLTHRSIRIALLPNPRETDPTKKANQLAAMQALTRQLKDVVFDSIVSLDDQQALSTTLQNDVMDKLDMHSNRVLIVSDKDEYLKAGRELGMITCRLHRKNERRGNITTQYNTASVPDLQDVVNEINGISFNTVLNR